MELKSYEWVAMILVVVGSLNWGLTVLGWNVVDMLLGSWPMVMDVVYGLVGLSGLWLAYWLYSNR